MKEIIYLDHAASTPMTDEVIGVMTQTLKENYSNASSIHQLGKRNRTLIEQAREVMGESIGAQAQEIIITSGGTESNNMALIKTAEAYAHKGKHIISTAIEHNAALKPLKYLETKGFEVSYLPANQDGQITVAQVKEAIRPDTILVSVIFANNELGSIQPIQEIGEYLNSLERKIYFHTDAVQAYGVLDINVDQLKVDLLSVSAHKMNGPKGVGFLYVRQGIQLPSLILGGSQENKHRAGTENVPAILGFKKAIELNGTDRQGHYHQLLALKNAFIERLQASKIKYSINGTIEEATPHVLSVSFSAVQSEMLLIQLDLNGIAVSAGSACSAGSLEESHVLTSIYGADAPEVTHTIRFSFGLGNTVEQINKVVALLEKFAG